MRPPKAAPVVRKFSPWDDLMDEGEMTNGCGAIRDNIRDYLGGGVSAVVVPLNDLLLLPLDAYIQRCRANDPESLEAEAAAHFFRVVQELACACGQIAFIPPSLTDGDDERWHTRLIAAWAGLLGASARQREHGRKTNQTSSGGRRGKLRGFSYQDLVLRMNAAGVSALTKDFCRTLEAEFNYLKPGSTGAESDFGPDDKVSCIPTMRRLLKQARKADAMPPKARARGKK